MSVSVKSGTVITGYLVSAEQRVEPSANPQMPVSRTRVTLKTLTGIEQFVLEDAGPLRFEDERLNMRMLSALEAIKRTSNSAIRDATISLVPGPDGVARFATVTRAPLWKTAYRLRLPQGPDGMARLTGWAVIENTETMGWTDVDVTLRSGNPVTFRQPIYQRADVDRPEAPIDAQPHPLPRIDQRGVPVAKAAPGLSPPLPAPMAPGFARMLAAPAPTLQGARDATTRQGALDATMGANAEAPEAPGDAAPDQPPLPDGVGESFHLRRPVTLAAGQSAALPFLEATVPFERIDMLPFRWPNPLRAVRITNTTRASWPGGGVSTQDEAGFSGDARLPPLPPGEARYLTYASDLSLTAHWDQASPSRRLVAYKVAEGVATLVLKQRTTTIVDLAGAAVPPPGDAGAQPASATTVIVEVPREAGTTVSVRGAVAADPTAAAWRARLAVAPGATAQVRIDVDRPLLQSVQVLDAATVLAGLLGEDLDGLAPPTLAALRQIADLQARRLQSQQEVANLLRDRSEAVADQQRARQNLQILTSNDPQRQRYVDLLGAAETRIEALTGRVERGREADRQLTAQLATAIAAFSIE